MAPYQIHYVVSHGKGKRFTYLRFKSDGTLQVVIPRGRTIDPEDEIRRRRAWILRQFESRSADKKILEEDRVMFDGKYLSIVFLGTDDGEGVQVDREKGVVVVRAVDASRVKELVRRWFLKETSRYVVRKLSELSSGFPKYRGADVREIRNWGYCTRTGRLSFSWQLIALPERLRVYVILHELTHLSTFDHSREFRRRLALVCPDFRQREKELDRVAPMGSYRSNSL